MKPLPRPNWKAKPIAQYRIPHTHVSKTHDISAFTGSRDRAKPASRAMNPACMKNTRNAVTSTQTVFRGLTTSPACTATSCMGDAPAAVSKNHANPLIAARTDAIPSIFPPRRIANCLRTSFSLNRLSDLFLMTEERKQRSFRHHVQIVTRVGLFTDTNLTTDRPEGPALHRSGNVEASRSRQGAVALAMSRVFVD